MWSQEMNMHSLSPLVSARVNSPKSLQLSLFVGIIIQEPIAFSLWVGRTISAPDLTYWFWKGYLFACSLHSGPKNQGYKKTARSVRMEGWSLHQTHKEPNSPSLRLVFLALAVPLQSESEQTLNPPGCFLTHLHKQGSTVPTHAKRVEARMPGLAEGREGWEFQTIHAPFSTLKQARNWAISLGVNSIVPLRCEQCPSKPCPGWRWLQSSLRKACVPCTPGSPWHS